MASFIKYIIVMVMAILVTMVAGQTSITMKALVLSTAQTDNEAITLNLQSYGIPYDVVTFSAASPFTGNLNLYDEDQQPKYNLVIVNGGHLLYEANGLWISALSSEQWAYLEDYEAKYHVRRVVLSDDVSSNPNVELYDPTNWGQSLDQQGLTVEKSKEVQQIFNDARIKITAPLDVNYIYHTRVRIVNTQTTTPFLYYTDANDASAVAAIISKYENGREEMGFFFGFGSWSQSSVILNHLWLTWGTRALFNGFRRVYFTPHIDDVFLSTNLVDVQNNNANGSETFRTGPADFEKFAQFQKEVLEEMPEGSLYRVELAFNGNGILGFGDYSQAIVVDGNRYVDLEYVMEPGTGDKRWPAENYQFSPEQYAAMEKDLVFNYFNHNETAQKEFFWSSHTFTHENLDNVAKSDVDNEIRLNLDLAQALGLTEKDYWSGGAIITPQISGLHSKDALETFQTYGITSAVGDLTRPAICNVNHPYLPFFTTLESSNYEGFPVIPRSPTEFYYFCSTPEENTWMYNEIYRSYFGRDSTFEEILDRESSRTLLLLTKLRHEAHQFHQANIRYYQEGEEKRDASLLEAWTRHLVHQYTQYVDWPLISLKSDQQAQTFIERAKLETCGPETKLLIENDKIVGVSVSATNGDCTIPVTVPNGAVPSALPEDATLEQIGKDPLTVWIPLQQGETKTFQFESPLDWDIRETVESTTEIVESTTEVVESTTTEITESTTEVIEPTNTEDVEPTNTEVVEPTNTEVIESTTVVEPTNTEVVESTTVVEPTNTEVVEPTNTEVVESTNTEVVESTTVVEPTNTEVVESTNTEVVESTTVVEPTNTEIVEPTNTEFVESTTVVEPTNTEVVESTTVVEPTNTEIVESTTVVEPTNTEIVESTTVVEPTNTEVVEFTTVVEPVNTEVVEPTNTEVVESTTIVEPTNTEVVETSVVEKTVTEYATAIVNETVTTTIEESTTLPTTVVEETEIPTPVTECNNGGFAQCGGIGFAGLNCCPEGFTCQEQNPYYSQCVLVN